MEEPKKAAEDGEAVRLYCSTCTKEFFFTEALGVPCPLCGGTVMRALPSETAVRGPYLLNE